ncbi:aminotransferase [Tribonema minus]|uniref:Aminotransferase n=1 Tax=Tribonema minus TaxID=303371 RepID=A0A835ZLS3_9STRA|nr:aminotransferase [Tribonema minus]
MYLRRSLTGSLSILALRRAVCLSSALTGTRHFATSSAAAEAAAASAVPMHSITRNGKPAPDLPATQDAKSMLSVYPRGAYTTARTVDFRSVFEFDAHVERMAQTSKLMLVQSGKDASAYPELTDPHALRPLLAASFRSCIQDFIDKYPDYQGEIRLTVLADWEEDHNAHGDFTLLCHGSPLPPIRPPPVVVEVRGCPRENALAKDSAWINERKGLEALKRPEHDEIILPTADGRLLEGTQTNFYAVLDGAVHTAGAGVLEGTVRRLLLEVCAREGIRVVLEAPALADMAYWEGALVSSTSRLALPVDRIVVPREGEPAQDGDACREFRDDALCRRIAQLVRGQVRSHSQDVFKAAKGCSRWGLGGGEGAAAEDAAAAQAACESAAGAR